MRTFAIIKPGADQRGIIDRILREGFTITHLMTRMITTAEVTALYGKSEERSWYPRHRAYMASGESVLLILERTDAVAHWRNIIGCADPRKAAPGSVRATFGDQVQEPGHCYRNAVHGSDTEAEAEREIAIFWGTGS